MRTRLEAFADEAHPLRRNRLLYGWLRDDAERRAFYDELHGAGCPVLRFTGLRDLQDDTAPADRDPTVYLLTSPEHLGIALKGGSVLPYSQLDSGGRFMLGLEAGPAHTAQRSIAAAALAFTPAQIRAAAVEAVDRAMVLPKKNPAFDLVTDVAQQAALRYLGLLFGLPVTAHVELERAMLGSYTRLSYQIVGRHFVSESGLPPSGSEPSLKLRADLEDKVVEGITEPREAALVGHGLAADTAIKRLFATHGLGDDDAKMIALGLMAGTVGNITAAIAIAIDRFFAAPDGAEDGLAAAMAAARRDDGDDRPLQAAIDAALRPSPPAPFLARVVPAGGLRLDDRTTLPPGAVLLLALGVDRRGDFTFGSLEGDDPAFPHRCVGRHLAWPLVLETVRQVLRLPGLARVIDPATGRPERLEKRWGAICTRMPMQFQRDRLSNQHTLHVVLKIKPPVAENAAKLKLLTAAGAFLIEEALRKSQHVHFAWFNLVDNDTHLAMTTVFDGDFDAYVEHFALKVSLFDEQFQYLADAPPTPIAQHPRAFVDVIRKFNMAPLGGYFFSAYPRVATADIQHAGLDRRE